MSESEIDVTDVDLVKLAKSAYDLSVPAGLGYLHYRESGMSDEEANILIKACKNDNELALQLSFVSP